MAAFLKLPRVLQRMICDYCDDVSEHTQFSSFGFGRVTFHHDGLQITIVPSCYQWIHLPTWSPVEVHVYKKNGTVIYLQNEKMHAHKPMRGDDVSMVCNHVLAPLANDPERFAFQDVSKWWIFPGSGSRIAFPYELSGVCVVVIFKNALREFV